MINLIFCQTIINDVFRVNPHQLTIYQQYIIDILVIFYVFAPHMINVMSHIFKKIKKNGFFNKRYIGNLLGDNLDIKRGKKIKMLLFFESFVSLCTASSDRSNSFKN